MRKRRLLNFLLGEVMKQRLVRGFVAAIFSIQVGCAHTQQRFAKDLDESRCEDALTNLPERDTFVQITDRAKVVGGSALSYSATGVAYVADVVVTVAGATLVFVALCGPILLLSSTSGGGGGNGSSGGPICIPADLSGLKLPRFGEQTYESTQGLRCPDLSGTSRSIRKVVSCFADRSDLESLQKAKLTLEVLAGSEKFNECVSAEEKVSLHEHLQQISARLD